MARVKRSPKRTANWVLAMHHSRGGMPRAYIKMILSSKPGKRRWYLAISCGSKLAWRSRGTSSAIVPVSVTTVFLP